MSQISQQDVDAVFPKVADTIADALGCALHLGVRGENTHHMIEACFKGVGRALLDYLLHDAWTRGLKRIQLSSLRDNRPMLGLAERLGFKPLREESGEIIMQALRPGDGRDAPVQAVNLPAAGERSEAAAPRQLACAIQMHKGHCDP